MNSNEVLNTFAESVFLHLTTKQAEILREELTSRRRHHAGRKGWLWNNRVMGGGTDTTAEIAAENRAECLDTLIAKVANAETLADAWSEHGERITDATREMRDNGDRLAVKIVGEDNVFQLRDFHIFNITALDWLRVWSALRENMCGLLLLKDEQYGPADGSQETLSLVFPLRLRELMNRVGKAFKGLGDNVRGDEVVMLIDRGAVQHVHKAIKRAANSASGRGGRYRSQYYSNPSKAATAEAEAASLRTLQHALESVLLEPYVVEREETE